MLPILIPWLDPAALAWTAHHVSTHHHDPGELVCALAFLVVALPLYVAIRIPRTTAPRTAPPPEPSPSPGLTVTTDRVRVELAARGEVVVGIHALEVVGQRIPWSEVQGVRRDGRQLQVYVTPDQVVVVRPRTSAGLAALEAACAEALGRARTLAPLDPKAVDAVRRLGAPR